MEKVVISFVVVIVVATAAWFLHVPELDERARRWSETPTAAAWDDSTLVALAGLVDMNPMPQDLDAACIETGRRCVAFIRDNRDVADSWDPDPRVFQHYDAVVTARDLRFFESEKPEANGNSAQFITATRMLVVRDLVEAGQVRAATIVHHLPHLRRHLSQSAVLADALVFVASTSIVAFAAVNAAGRVDAADRGQLVEVLRPIAPDEFGFDSASGGEVRYFAAIVDADQNFDSALFKRDHFVNVVSEQYAAAVRWSELPEAEFWTQPFEPHEMSFTDQAINPFGVMIVKLVEPATVSNYVANARLLNIPLALAMGVLRSESPPPSKAWVWSSVDGQVCLVPSGVHPNVWPTDEAVCPDGIVSTGKPLARRRSNGIVSGL